MGRTVDEDPDQLNQERTWILEIRRGHLDAWGSIYDLYAKRLFRTILMPRLAQPAAAEDALAETFRVAIEKIQSFEDQGHGIYPWLCRIAHNKAMDMFRASHISGRKIHDLGRLLGPLSEPVRGADDLFALRSDETLFKERLQNAMDSINPRYRTALELRFLEENSRERCAEIMELKVGTLDVLVLRALRALKSAWAELSPPSSGARQ